VVGPNLLNVAMFSKLIYANLSWQHNTRYPAMVASRPIFDLRQIPDPAFSGQSMLHINTDEYTLYTSIDTNMYFGWKNFIFDALIGVLNN